MKQLSVIIKVDPMQMRAENEHTQNMLIGGKRILPTVPANWDEIIGTVMYFDSRLLALEFGIHLSHYLGAHLCLILSDAPTLPYIILADAYHAKVKRFNKLKQAHHAGEKNLITAQPGTGKYENYSEKWKRFLTSGTHEQINGRWVQKVN